MSSHALRLTAPVVRRPLRRPTRAADRFHGQAAEVGTGWLRLVGIALLGWVGVMTLVAALAV